MIRHILLAIFLCALSAGCAASQTLSPPETVNSAAILKQVREPVTILISIDGFRPDYMQRGITPNLSALADTGIHGPMRPSFPTKTFPNHYTLVTGKRPDVHGIVGNAMEDSDRPGEIFTMATKDPFWWSGAEPIWSTAEQQGIRTATMFWPGSEVQWKDKQPSDWWPFSINLSNDRRVNAVVDWIRRPDNTRPRLITLYFDSVDTAGHYFGPAPSEKLHKAIGAIDSNIGSLQRQIAALNQPVNYVIVSDHGMTETSPDRVIYLDNILPRDQYRLIVEGNYAGIEPLKKDKTVINTAFLKPHDNMECWPKDKIPAHFQYGHHKRVPTIICLPEIGWVVYQDKPEWMVGTGGGHGYDHRAADMTAFFVASGPNIKSGDELPIFDNVNIYSLIAHLAGIKPEDSDGDLSPFEQMLKP